MTDFYELLGVAPSATDDDIKRAYRKLARELHPDANPGDAAAEERFKEVSAAYEVLRDPERRRRYDTFGDDGRQGGGAPGDAFGFGDIFDAFFSGGFGGGNARSGPPRGQDAETVVQLDLVDAAFGVTTTVEIELPGPCDRCEGTGGEPGTHPERCPECDGTGEVRQVRKSILGQLVTAAPCFRCDGIGQIVPNPCTQCRGDGRMRTRREIEVEVPAGIDDGQRLRLPGRGPAAPRGGAAGDLYVLVRVRSHPSLERHGVDLVHRRTIAMTQAALGATFELETLDGTEQIAVEPGTQPGHLIQLRGRGVPVLNGRGRGDLIVEIGVEVPHKLSAEEAELLVHLAELRGEEIDPPEGGFFSKIRAAFGDR
ncbi:MAG: molecular chaperone DnaJ [Acidimicrobiia bacterium]